MVKPIYETSMTIPFFDNEDAFFTGIVANKMLNYSLYAFGEKYTIYDGKQNDPCFYL